MCVSSSWNLIMLDLAISVLLVECLFGISAQTTFDACQTQTGQSTSFKIIASIYTDRPGICTCAISITNPEYHPGSIPGTNSSNIRVNITVPDDGDLCGFVVANTRSGIKQVDCSTCFSFPSLTFNEDNNYTLVIGRAFNYSDQWFTIDASASRRQLDIRCWFNSCRRILPPCGTTSVVTSEERGVDVDENDLSVDTRPNVVGILGWCVSGLLVVVIIGLLIYTRFKSTRSDPDPERIQTPQFDNNLPIDTHGHGLDSDTSTLTVPQQMISNGNDGIVNESRYQDLQFRSGEQLYEAIVDASRTNDDMYEQPVVSKI